MKRIGLILCALLCAICYLTHNVAAQEFRASVNGTINDATGAPIPGARVAAVNAETGVSSSAVTNDEGRYVILSLQPGRYRIEVEQGQFKKFVQQGITLNIGDNTEINISLEAGSLQETVTITQENEQLQTSDSTRGTTITGRAVQELPLNGRNPFALAALSPGVSFAGARGQAFSFFRTTATNGVSSVGISGGQTRSNEVLLDGVPNTGSDGIIQFVPSTEATAEFRVQLNTFDAEFGRFTGGVINASIKSGTNNVNGALFYFHRNAIFNARDPFALNRPTFTYHLYGGAIGGPIIKNKTFFFFNFEGSREGVPRTFVSTVPTARQRAGDFRETATIIYDPLTTVPQGGGFIRSAFNCNGVANVICPERISPIARSLLANVPLPNQPGTVNNLILSFRDPLTDDSVVAKVDHNFSDNHKLFGRFSFRKFQVTRQGNFQNALTTDFDRRYSPGIALDDTYTFQSGVVLNFRYGLARFLNVGAADISGVSATGLPSVLGGVPRILINGYRGIGEANRLLRAEEDVHTLRAAATQIYKSHTFRYGAEFRYLRSNNSTQNAATNGSFSFNANFTRGPNPVTNTNNAQQAFAGFLLGLPTTGQFDTLAQPADDATYWGFYFQDDYRVNSKLTLNLGLRYEFEGAYTERYNRINRGFDLTAASPIDAAARAAYAANPIPQLPASQFAVRGGLLFAGVSGQPTALTEIDRNNFAPRVGFAYQITTKTVIRGGYGLFYGAATQGDEARFGFSTSTPFSGTLDQFTPNNTLSNPFPGGINQPPGASLGLATSLGTAISFINPERKNPFTHQYQISVQREIPFGFLLDVAYAGSTGRDLPVATELNALPESVRAEARAAFLASGGTTNILTQQVANPFRNLINVSGFNGATIARGQLLRPFPQFAGSADYVNGATGVTLLGNSIGKSRYDALQAKLSRRITQGFNAIVSYTFSKQIDQVRFLNNQDAAPVKEIAEFDTPHRFVLSGIYELPFGPGKTFGGNSKGFFAKLIEGYQLNVIYQAQSGIPLTFSNAVLIGDPTLPPDEQSPLRFFNTAAFRRLDTLERVSTSRIPQLRSAGRNNLDLSVFKNTQITERFRLQLRAEGFNLFNRPEYSSPDTNFNNATFGRITSTNTFARQFQFGLRLLF